MERQRDALRQAEPLFTSAPLPLCTPALIALAYALFDELHQKLVPGRGFELTDIGYDLAGIILHMPTVSSPPSESRSPQAPAGHRLRLARSVLPRVSLPVHRLFYTGITRTSRDILEEQQQDTQRQHDTVVDSLHRTKEPGYQVKEALEQGDLQRFGLLLFESAITTILMAVDAASPGQGYYMPVFLDTGNLAEIERFHRVNVTATMSAQQCFLAALASVTYVSIFGGRVNNVGYNVCGELTRLRKVLDQFGLKSQIIAGSTREILNVIEWLEAGTHMVTVVPHLLEGMLVHPYTKETVQMFLRDAARAEEMLKRSSA